jgi:hypothetical protein
MNTAADTLANAMREAATAIRPAPSTSIDRANSVPVAIALIEENEGLSDTEFDDAAQCITTNPMVASIYVSMSDHSKHSRYIRKQVDKYRGYA